jgi:paraquat-inducible protein B
MMADPSDHPTARHARRLPLIWVVPLVALLAAGWLGWRTLSERGPLIWISMQSAEGIEAGKTKIKHRDIELGTVESIEPSADLTRVTVEARMNVYAKAHLNKHSRFWVMRPRLSAEGISGLSTLISGSYIEMDPGDGAPERHFTALEEPPVVSADVPGTHFVLKADRLGSIIQGAPVSFRGIKVGQILGYELSDQEGSATVQIFVRAPHDALVHEGTRFWNASGVTVELGSNGLRLQTESLQAILTGGIAFDVPPGGEAGATAQAGATFILYSNAEKARDALYTRKVPFLLHFAGNVDGLAVGAPVRLRGIPIGVVTELHLEYDAKTDEQSVPVTIEVEPQRVKLLHIPYPEEGFRERAYDTFRRFVSRGMRARLVSGSLITGQKLVALDFVPDAKPAAMIEGGIYPELPTMDSTDLDSVLQSAKALMESAKFATDGIGQTIRSQELKRSMESLDRALSNVDVMTREASTEIGPLLKQLRSASRSADRALQEAARTFEATGDAFSTDNQGGDLAGLLSELREAAASLHTLTDSLERHPESLIKGKSP